MSYELCDSSIIETTSVLIDLETHILYHIKGRMVIKKIIITIFLPVLLVTLLSSQSLVELAKKEKERRAKLKGKKGIVVTNADLAKLRKKPAISISIPDLAKEESPIVKITPKSLPPKQVLSPTAEVTDKEGPENLVALEERWEKAKEYVDLLTLKINSLWIKFYSFEDWTLRDDIQRDMNKTYIKLQKAKKDVEKAKKELDKQRTKKRK